MKLNYYVLWVEDDNSWFETTSELFSNIISEYGFNPQIERKKSLDEVVSEMQTNGLKNYDIFLIDFKLRNSADGDSIIDFLRDKSIYTDVIFYSSDKQSIIDSIKEHLFEGVYHSDRKEIEDKFEKIFQTTIKKIEEINSMRGLIVGETSELDSIIEEFVLKFVDLGLDKAFDVDEFVANQIFDKAERNIVSLKEKFVAGGILAIMTNIEAIRKWELLRGILKKNKDFNENIPIFLKGNASYQDEVIDIRNKFAHSKVIKGDGGIEFLKSQIGEQHYQFDEESFKQIRENLRKHRNLLVDLKTACA